MKPYLLVPILFAALFIVGCGGAPAPPPTANPNVPTVILPFTPISQTVELPTLLPTVIIPTVVATTPAPIVVVVTATPTSTSTPTTTSAVTRAPTRIATTPTPAAPAQIGTPIPNNLPQVLVTALTVNPTTPKPDNGGVYTVTFQNQSGEEQTYEWCVEIWNPDNVKNSFGHTDCKTSNFPVGTTTLTSTGWEAKGLGACTPFRARAVITDGHDNRTAFIKPDGTILWLDYSVCP